MEKELIPQILEKIGQYPLEALKIIFTPENIKAATEGAIKGAMEAKK